MLGVRGVEGVEGGVGAATLRAKLKEKVARLRDSMLTGLVDRDEPVRLLLAAMLAGEHMLLIGPPGTAKSELARRLHGVVGGAYFERLLTRFSVPEELFGPLSLRELDNDRYVRRVEGFLPSASVAFVDEVFKANSAILNALLTILNERLFDNGATREPVPLVSLVGASNELPTGDELAALYDRFLVRYQVGSVTAERFAEMALATESAWSPPPESERLTDAELGVVRDAARVLPVAPDVADLLRSLREQAPALGLTVSDRRWKKIVKLLRTIAVVDGRDEVTRWDFWIVQHCVWSTPEQRPAVAEWYEKQLGVDASATPERTSRVIAAMRAELAEMREATDVVLDAQGKPKHAEPRHALRGKEHLYRALPEMPGDPTNGGKGYTKSEMQQWIQHHGYYRHRQLDAHLQDRSNWLMAPPEPLLQPRRYRRVEIDDCIEELAGPKQAVANSLRDLERRVREVDDLVASHVIVPATFRAPALAGLRANQKMLETARDELSALEQGFLTLPRRPDRDLKPSDEALVQLVEAAVPLIAEIAQLGGQRAPRRTGAFSAFIEEQERKGTRS